MEYAKEEMPDALSLTRDCRKMTSPAAADLVRSRKPGEVGARFAPANRVTGEGAAGHAMNSRRRFSFCANAFGAY